MKSGHQRSADGGRDELDDVTTPLGASRPPGKTKERIHLLIGLAGSLAWIKRAAVCSD